MYWITHISKSNRFNRQRQSSDRPFTKWLKQLNDRLMLHDTVRKERASLAKLDESQLRDIGVHQAEAEQESQRSAFDLPLDRV